MSTLIHTGLSAKNFPFENNVSFPGAGERTNHITSFHNETGLSFNKIATILTPSGNIMSLQPGTKVHVIKPGILYRGSAIGATNSRGIFTKVGLSSTHDEHFVGYAMIHTITKPSSKHQTRLRTGAIAQMKVGEWVKSTWDKKEIDIISTAQKGSTKADLILSVSGHPVQFEVKGTGSVNAAITLFDKSIRRDTHNELTDEFARIVSSGIHVNFVDLVDEYRKIDNSIGFPGDVGVGKSGKLPSKFKITDVDTLMQLREILITHFKSNNDNYFAVYDWVNGKTDAYWTGYGENVLELPPLPQLKTFSLQTYGGPSGGAMRVGLKVRFN
jgi:hypothetical protein